MRNLAFEPCIPTRGTKVPAGPDWLHEIKHDGYRLIVHTAEAWLVLAEKIAQAEAIEAPKVKGK